MLRDGMNAGEAGESGAAEDVGENGLGLIIGGMSDGDVHGVAIGDELTEEGVAGSAGSVFEIGFVALRLDSNVRVGDAEGQFVFGGELGHEVFVCVGGTAAELMVEVCDAEDDAELCAKFEEQVQESNGIGAAGDGYGDAVARVNEMLGAHVLQQTS
jgi:hypothetical protein